MNIKSTLKKIFNSYDFLGNRIKNLRVDTPDESIEYRESKKDTPNPDDNYFGPTIKNGEDGPGGHQNFVANKKYVDQKTTLNTDKTWKYKHPFFIWWMKEKDIAGKPYKEVFDELFFPKIEYQFKSPEITDVNIFVKNSPLIDVLEIDNNFKKFVIFNNCQNDFEIKIKQEKNDWISSVVGQIIFEDNNNNIIDIFTSETTDNSESIFKINNLLWSNIGKIKFKRIFDNYRKDSDVVNTYGEKSKPLESTYTLEYDITKYFIKTCYIFSLQDLNNIYIKNISIKAREPKLITIKVNNSLFTKQYCLKAYIYDDFGYLLNTIIMNHKDFTKDLNGFKTYNFGYYPFNVNIQIVPQAIRLI